MYGIAILILPAVSVKANLLENPAFEEGALGNGVHCWGKPAKCYSIEAGCGMNGTRALVCDTAKGTGSFPCQYVEAKPGAKLHLSCKVRTEALVGTGPRNEGAAIGLQAFNANGEVVSGGGDIWGPSGDSDWKLIERIYTMPVDVAKVRVFLYADRPTSGKAYYDDIRLVEVLPKPVDVLASSAYRGMASDGKVSFAAGVNLESSALKVDEVLGKFIFETGAELTVGRIADGVARVSVDVKDLPMGTSTVVFNLCRTKDGSIVGAATNHITRVKKLPNRSVWIDSAGRTIVNGKPFFPLGMFCSSYNEKVMSVYTNGPFNCVLPYWPANKETLDRAAAGGLMLICSVKDMWGGSKHEYTVRNRIKTDEDANAFVAKMARELKHHPALLAWYVNDEGDVKGMPRYRKRYEVLTENDPDHPTYGVFYQYADTREYMFAHDVLGIDPYPVPRHKISRVLDETRIVAKRTFGFTPAWHVPQAFDWTSVGVKNARPPTEDELRNMTWQAIAGGANGIVYYAYYKLNPFQEKWGECCRVGEEVKRLFPVLLADPAEGFSVSGAPEHLGWRVWKRGGETYLLLVNATREKMSATLGLPAVTALSGKEFGRGEARLNVFGQLEVSFSPLDVAIFRLR